MNTTLAYKKYNELFYGVLAAIRKHIKEDKEELIEFGENGFEDDANNDLCAIDTENVYFGTETADGYEDSYPLSELSLLDAIKILGDFESNVIGDKVKAR